jgi:hypothetical protein
MTRLTDAGSGLSLRVVGIDFGMRVLSGSYATEANMDQFVRSQNVERYRRLLERMTEE